MRNPCSWVWVAFVVAATSVPAASDAQESELAQPVIAPAMPMSDEALSIVLPKTADVSVVWIKDGEETTQSGLTLPAKYTKRGELWAVRVTGKGSSTSVRSDAVTIRNSPPTVGKLVLKPEYVDATTPLTCMPISVRDADRDQLALRYRWLVDDQPVRMTTDTMEAGRLKRGQSVRCELTVLDGQSASEPVASEVRTVGNSPPTAGSLVLHPDEATVLSDLRCSLDSVGDADREALRYAFRWTQGGGEGEKAWTIETKTPSSTVAAKDLKRGQVLSCTGQVLDAEAASDPLTKRVVIQNSAARRSDCRQGHPEPVTLPVAYGDGSRWRCATVSMLACSWEPSIVVNAACRPPRKISRSSAKRVGWELASNGASPAVRVTNTAPLSGPSP